MVVNLAFRMRRRLHLIPWHNTWAKPARCSSRGTRWVGEPTFLYLLRRAASTGRKCALAAHSRLLPATPFSSPNPRRDIGFPSIQCSWWNSTANRRASSSSAALIAGGFGAIRELPHHEPLDRIPPARRACHARCADEHWRGICCRCIAPRYGYAGTVCSTGTLFWPSLTSSRKT